MNLKQPFKSSPNVRVLINIGCLFDIPTGTYHLGRYGESILNGGLGFLTGTVGSGNSFKSVLMQYMNMRAMARIHGSTYSTYDTEINTHESRLRHLASCIKEFRGHDPLDTEQWVVTDKTIYTGDEWYELSKGFMQDKRKNVSALSVKTPFLDRDGVELLIIIQPTFASVDSFSDFTTKDVIKMQDENELGDSGANTIFMRQGLQKTRLLQEITGLAGGSYTYVSFVAQIGDKFEMDQRNPKQAELSYLKGSIELKGVPNKFTFHMNNCWHCFSTVPLINQGTRGPEYPRDSSDTMQGDTDLTLIRIRQLRGKSGPSGMPIEIIASQQDGILPSLSEFHYLKESERFGFEGSLQNYNLVLCPDIKLSRTTIRGKINKHPELERALNFLAELRQMYDLWHFLKPEEKPTPKALYEGLINLGYDWNVLLNTRGWWALEGTWEDVPFLSTMDLIRMLNSDYIPYWMEHPPQKALDAYNSKNATPWVYPLTKSKPPKSS